MSYDRARKHADEAFRDHQMTVLHEDEVYRHLRFARAESWMYGFDLVTWPGHLSVGGDIEGYVFQRTHDMVEFFAGDQDINPDYWVQKLANRQRAKTYSHVIFEKTVDEHLVGKPAARRAWREHVELVELHDERAAREALSSFEYDGHLPFQDSWEWDLSDWDHHFLLSCFAIKHGVTMYRERQVVAA